MIETTKYEVMLLGNIVEGVNELLRWQAQSAKVDRIMVWSTLNMLEFDVQRLRDSMSDHA